MEAAYGQFTFDFVLKTSQSCTSIKILMLFF